MHRPLYPLESAPVFVIEGVAWASGRMLERENLLHPPGFKHRAVQPAASRYTDDAAPIANCKVKGTNVISCETGTEISRTIQWESVVKGMIVENAFSYLNKSYYKNISRFFLLIYSYNNFYVNKRTHFRLRVFENRVLRRVFGPKRDEVTEEWRKLHNEELSHLYSWPNIVRVVKSRRMRWAGHVARMVERRVVHRVLVGKPEGRRPLGRPRRRWEDNIKTDL